MSKNIMARLQAIIAEDNADPNPGYISWDAHPAGWKRFHAWQARAARRAREKRLLRRQLTADGMIRALERFASHPDNG